MILHARSQRRSATTAVECAIVYPATFLLTLGLAIGGLGIFRYQQVAHLAREGARFASVHGGQYASDNAASIKAGTLPIVNEAYLQNNIIQARATGLDTTKLAVQVNINTYNGSFDWDDTASTYNRAPASSYIQNGVIVGPIQNSVSVTVTYPWVPELYLVGPINLQSTAVLPLSY
jgi:hypothetical protein